MASITSLLSPSETGIDAVDIETDATTTGLLVDLSMFRTLCVELDVVATGTTLAGGMTLDMQRCDRDGNSLGANLVLGVQTTTVYASGTVTHRIVLGDSLATTQVGWDAAGADLTVAGVPSYAKFILDVTAVYTVTGTALASLRIIGTA